MYPDLQKKKADPGNQDWDGSWLEQLLRALLVAAGLELCTWKYAQFYNHSW